MSTATQSQVKKWDPMIIHALVTAAIMIGFGYLPAVGALTPYGMRVIGIFFGLIYGWITCGLVLPNMMAFFAVLLFDVMPLNEFLAAGLGADTTMLLIFAIILITAVNESGLGRYMAAWLLSRKILEGRPWIFTLGFLLATFLLTSFANPYVTIIIFWGILYNVLNIFDIKAGEMYATIMVCGVVLAATLGMSVFPFKGIAMILLKVYQNISGVAVGYAQWIIFVFVMGVLSVIGYILIARFIFRVDVSKIKNISSRAIDQSDLEMTPSKKWMLFFLLSFIGIVLLSGFLPATLGVVVVLKRLGTVGVLVGVLMVMLMIKVDDKPLLDFNGVAKRGMLWDMITCCIVVLPIAAILTTEATGLQPFLVALLNPVFAGMSPMLFMFSIALLGILLTNFLQNFIVALMFIPIMCSFTAAMGVDSAAGAVLLIFGVHLALLTPAASPFAAMLFANTEWIKPTDVYKIMSVTLTLLALLCATVGLAFVSFLF